MKNIKQNKIIRDNLGRWLKGSTNAITHGMSKSPTHTCWKNMRRRCETKSSSRYKNYGARGIKVCDRWKIFENFLNDMGEKPSGLTLERIDVDKDYQPDNCRWASPTDQHFNKTNTRYIDYNGEKIPLGRLCREFDIRFNVVWKRLSRGWDIEKALKTPNMSSKTRNKGETNGLR